MNPQSHLQLSPEGFLFDHYSGASFTLNRSGVRILELLIEGLDRESILQRLETTWPEAGRERLAGDLDGFLARLESHRLLRAGEAS